MIKITIEITDTPLPDGRFYGRIEAFPDNVGEVTNTERMVRDMIMNAIKAAGEFMGANMPGVTGAFVAEVPARLRKERKDEGLSDSNDRRS